MGVHILLLIKKHPWLRRLKSPSNIPVQVISLAEGLTDTTKKNLFVLRDDLISFSLRSRIFLNLILHRFLLVTIHYDNEG